MKNLKKCFIDLTFIFLIALFSASIFSFGGMQLRDKRDCSVASMSGEIVSPPEISSTLISQEVELDEDKPIEIPQPTVHFESGDYTTYDVKDDAENINKRFVLRGVNSDGKATNWTTNNKDATNGKFVPTATGVFEIQYLVKLEAYDRTKFDYIEGVSVYDENSDITTYTQGHYTFKDVEGSSLTIADDGTYRIENAGNYFVLVNDEGTYKFYAADSEYKYKESDLVSDILGDSCITGIDEIDWNKDIRVYNLESEIYTITVKDTKGPKLIDYDYSDQEVMSVAEFKAKGIKIFAIEATDASGIDASKSQILLTWKLANGTLDGNTGSKIYSGEDAFINQTYTSSALNLDGTYTITYEVYDNNGTSTAATYTIAVGDCEGPSFVFPADFVKTNYALSDSLVIDLDPTKVIITDNNPMPADAQLKVKLVNTSKNNEEVKYTEQGTKISFDAFEKYGEGIYKLIIEAQDAVGNVTAEEFEFTVEARYLVEIQIVGEGEATISPKGDEGFVKGEKVTITIKEVKGWLFSKIEGVTLAEDKSFEVTEDVTIKVIFVPKKVSFASTEKGVELETTANIISEDATFSVKIVEESDQRYTLAKNHLSNPDKLIIYDITITEGDESVEQLSEKVTLKIKLDGRFDEQKVKVFRVNVQTGEKQEHSFLYLDGYVVLQTDHFSLYTFSQSEGFKPVSPSKDGTNKMMLVLIIFGVVGLVAVVAIAVLVVVRKKKN